MRKDELQYLADTIIIEKLASEYEIDKKGGVISSLFGGLFGGVASEVMAFGQEKLRSDQPGGLVGGLIELVATGAIFSISPILGVIYSIASEVFGFDLRKVAMDIISYITPQLESGLLSQTDINNATKGAISAQSGGAEKTSSINLDLSPLRKEAWGRSSWNRQGLASTFLGLGRRRSTSLFGGIIGWLIKTLLLGAGLKLGIGYGAKLLGLKHTPEGAEKAPEGTPAPGLFPSAPAVVEQAPQSQRLQPSGRGEQHFPNDANSYWVVPLINGNIEDTLKAWAVDVYPDLGRIGDAMEASPFFQRAVGLLKGNWRSSSPNRLTMPKGFNNRKQVVDIFAGDLANKLQG